MVPAGCHERKVDHLTVVPMAVRRIVPDTSILLAGYFRERLSYQGQDFDATRRAKPVVDAIRGKIVRAFAPEALRYEFLKRAYQKSTPRDGQNAIPIEIVNRHVEDFLRLPITYLEGHPLVEDVWRLAREHDIPPTDGWFVACAQSTRATLWLLSQRQKDRLVSSAQRVHPEVSVLTETRFA